MPKLLKRVFLVHPVLRQLQFSLKLRSPVSSGAGALGPTGRVGFTTRCGRGRVGLLPASAHLSRRRPACRAHNAPPAAVDHRPRNCAHTHWRIQSYLFTLLHGGDCLVTCDEDFRGGSRVLLCGGQSQGSWRWEGWAAGGEIVKLFR